MKKIVGLLIGVLCVIAFPIHSMQQPDGNESYLAQVMPQISKAKKITSIKVNVDLINRTIIDLIDRRDLQALTRFINDIPLDHLYIILVSNHDTKEMVVFGRKFEEKDMLVVACHFFGIDIEQIEQCENVATLCSLVKQAYNQSVSKTSSTNRDRVTVHIAFALARGILANMESRQSI